MNCIAEDCNKPQLTKKLCRSHYEKQRLEKLGPCTIPTCNNRQTARGYCTRHYWDDLSKNNPQCPVATCQKKQHCSTSPFCKYHYDIDIGSVMKGKYGIDLKEFNAMMAAQNHKCAICKKDVSELAEERFKRFSVDHDHATGNVRGLLCQKCNFGLGNFKDDVSLLHNAIEYLEKGKK